MKTQCCGVVYFGPWNCGERRCTKTAVQGEDFCWQHKEQRERFRFTRQFRYVPGQNKPVLEEPIEQRG